MRVYQGSQCRVPTRDPKCILNQPGSQCGLPDQGPKNEDDEYERKGWIMDTEKKRPSTIKAKPEDCELMDALREGRFTSRADYLHYLLLLDQKQLQGREGEKEARPQGILSDEELEVRLARSGYLSVKDAEVMRRQMGGRQLKEEEAGDEKESEKPPDRGAAL